MGDEEDVWSIPIERGKEVEHSAFFPKELVKRCILTGSPQGGVVLDPFLGSGTTLEVAGENGRNAVGIELSSLFFQSAFEYLVQEGARVIEWKTLVESLSKPAKGWKKWRGNKINFRKPGTKPKASTFQE